MHAKESYMKQIVQALRTRRHRNSPNRHTQLVQARCRKQKLKVSKKVNKTRHQRFALGVVGASVFALDRHQEAPEELKFEVDGLWRQ